MASPFAHFRKYQAILLAVFGVLIMFVFVISDVMNKFTSSHAGEDPVAVTWTGGKVTSHELNSMVGARMSAVRFMRDLQRQAYFRTQDQRFLDPRRLVINEDGLNGEATFRTMLMA